MENREIILIAVLVLASVGILVIFSFSGVYESPEQGACRIIAGSGEENKIDIVFLTDNINQEKTENYANFFLDSEPFSLNKEKFNFFYAGESECSLKDDSLLYCYSRDLIKKASSCKNDYVIVLSSRERNIRSTAYMNVMSININHPFTVLLHEFGHVFANLADEYVPSVLPRGAENCETQCEKFEVGDGCYEGCSKNSLYRASENSVMRTLGISDYKKLNTKLIEENLGKYA